MHCENTIFSYNNEFKEYMKVEGAVSEDIFDYLFIIRGRKFLLKKEKKYLRNIFLNYFRNRTRSIFN